MGKKTECQQTVVLYHQAPLLKMMMVQNLPWEVLLLPQCIAILAQILQGHLRPQVLQGHHMRDQDLPCKQIVSPNHQVGQPLQQKKHNSQNPRKEMEVVQLLLLVVMLKWASLVPQQGVLWGHQFKEVDQYHLQEVHQPHQVAVPLDPLFKTEVDLHLQDRKE